MKNYIFILLLIAGNYFCFSQNQSSDFSGNKSDQARNPRNDLMNFAPNEVLVKFKDAIPVTTGARVKAAGVNSVDLVLQSYGITSLEKLFPTEQKPVKARMMKSPQGKEFKVPALDKIFRVSIPEKASNANTPTNIFQLIEELKALPEVEYAEPNYIYSIDNMQPVGPVLTAEDVAKLQPKRQKSSITAITPNDPLYGQQWYIPAVKADMVWEQTTGDTTQVIAILDTGVDWSHPDLKNKIWTNPNPNTSPDANGVVNDIRGWDYINNDNNPMDDNSHGTHVAGIAAAETNNGIGIAGVCPKAKIMPIKVFQSSGQGDVSTITKGIIYASNHGATVINMSFGSYARSLTMEDALANAYATCVLVAASGNDDIDINDPNIPSPIFYPSALSFVFGIQATQSTINNRLRHFKDGTFLSDFTNYDSDGSTFSKFDNLFNYELCAPGSKILSVIPNGNYRVYQGTSMAAPIISGIVCLFKNKYPDYSQEMLWGNLINSSQLCVDIQSAINTVTTPKLMFVSRTMVDTLAGDNKNDIVNAGETIELWFKIRNTWGQCDSVIVELKHAEFEDTTLTQIITTTALIGSVSTYASRTNEHNPLKIHVNSNVTHNRDITFTALLYYPNSLDTIKQNIVINITNGEELKGVMDSTLTLTHDKLWIVNQSFRVGVNGFLKIQPGTHVILKSTIVNRGLIQAIGKKDSLIILEGPEAIGGYCGYNNNGSISYDYVYFKDLSNTSISANSIKNCVIDNFYTIYGCPLIQAPIVENTLIKNSRSHFSIYAGRFYKNNIVNNVGIGDFYVYNASSFCKYNNFYKMGGPDQLFRWIQSSDTTMVNNNNFIDFKSPVISTYGLAETIYFPMNYWGSTDMEKIKKMYSDFWSGAGSPFLNINPILTQPSDSCHAITWKVLVNGKDAQDEYIEPIGVGKQRFDVYFNKAMDKTIIPTVSFGVRYPYNQQTINEEGYWSENGRIYTVYKTMKLTTGDGINNIRVSGAFDLEGWEIPIEDSRFSFVISAANSASAEFMASAGLGKVKLEWNNSDLEDGLGYNMYRMEHINDSTLTEPTLINSSLITDTLYTDFVVTPNKKYYYYYKVLRTNMSETDPSKVVSAIPFTAAKGDANGDLSVNVLDITSIVAYLLNNNPQPFIFEAADMNSDTKINVLDIVGVVNKILNVPQNAPSIAMTKQVDLFLENDTIFANSNVDIGGIQLDIKGVQSIEDIRILSALSSFESGNSIMSDSLRLIFYSMSGKNIPAGQRIPLLKLKSGSTILDAIFGETNGSPIKVNYIMTRIPNIESNMNQTIAELGQNFPNPVNGKTVIPVRIYEPVDEAVLRVINMMGQEVEVIRLSNPYIGEHLLPWNSKANKGLFIYTLDIKSGNHRRICPIKKMIVQ